MTTYLWLNLSLEVEGASFLRGFAPSRENSSLRSMRFFAFFAVK